MSRVILSQVVLVILVLLVLLADGFTFFSVLIQGKGTSFDLYLPWYGSREIIQGRNPYTASVTEQIQIATIGHVAMPGENEYRFVYPAYIAFLLLPLLPMPFPLAVTVWIVLQQVFLVVALVLVCGAMNWRPLPWSMMSIIVVGILFRYSLITVVLAQNSMMTLVLLAAAMYASSRGKYEWAGIALALATFKPQLVVFPILGWFVWMAAQRQWRALFVFAGAIGFLIVLPTLFIGNWLISLWEYMSVYWGYTGSQSPLTLFVSLAPGDWRGTILFLGGLVGVIYLAWVAWRKRDTALVFGLSVLLTLVIVPLSSVYDLALLVLPLLIGWTMIRASHGVEANFLRLVLIAVPILSWTIILVIPSIFDILQLPFDAVIMDKILTPLILLGIWIRFERRYAVR
jgi:hypothetical protein